MNPLWLPALPQADGAILAAAGVIFCAAVLSSVAGFAFSALAGAALLRLLGDPMQTVAVLVVCSIAIQAYSVWALRGSIEWSRLRPFLGGGLVTVPAGVWLLARVPAEQFALALGGVVACYAAYMLLRRSVPAIRAGRNADIAVGAIGGLLGGLAGLPGLLVTVWCGMRGWTKEQQRATYQPFILAMQVETLFFLQSHAPSAMDYAAFALYVPVALGAACVGLSVFRRLTHAQFGVAVNSLLAVAGIALLGPALF